MPPPTCSQACRPPARSVRITTREIGAAARVEVAERARVDAAPHRLELRRAGCIAASFGAPVIEPGGKAARSASSASQPARKRPRTVETSWNTRRVALDREQLRHLDAARRAHAAEIVAHEIDDHQVLGALLRGGAQLGGAGARPRRGRAARPRALDRPALDAAVRVDAQEALGRAADDRHLRQLEERRERRRAAFAQRVGRVATRRPRTAPRADASSSPDTTPPPQSPRRIARHRLRIRIRIEEPPRSPSPIPPPHRLGSGAGRQVIGFVRLLGGDRRGDRRAPAKRSAARSAAAPWPSAVAKSAAARVFEGEHAIDQQPCRVGQAEIAARLQRDALDVRGQLVAEPADRAAGERNRLCQLRCAPRAARSRAALRTDRRATHAPRRSATSSPSRRHGSTSMRSPNTRAIA